MPKPKPTTRPKSTANAKPAAKSSPGARTRLSAKSKAITTSKPTPEPTSSATSGFATDTITVSAVSTVFNTIELLEIILLNLPCKDVLLSQRVSTTWQNTFTGSLRLQKALCFVPSQQPGVRMISDDAPPCAYYFEFQWQRQTRISSTSDFTAQDVCDAFDNGELILNPLFTKLFKEAPCDDPFSYNRANAVADIEDSSWKRMFMTQPPLAGIMLHSKRKLPAFSKGHHLLYFPNGIESDHVNTLHEESGIKVLHFVEHLESTFDSVAGSRLRFDILAL